MLREILAHFGVTFDDGQLKQGAATIDGVLGSLKGLAGSVGGAFAVGAIWHFVTAATESADAILKQAEALGLSYVELKEWNYAASLSNVEADTLAATLAKLSGGKYNAKSLAQLGVDAKQSNGDMKSATDLLEDVGEALSKIEDPTKRNTLAMGVLGKSYSKLLPLLKDGSKGIKEMRDEYHELGGGFSDDFAKKSEEFNDNVTRLQFIFKTTAGTIISALLPSMLRGTQTAIRFARTIVPLLKNSKLLETAFIALSLRGVVALSKQLGPLGAGFRALSRHVLYTLAPLAILEDFLVFLAGGDSLIGRALEGIFGEGTGDQVRAAIFAVWNDFTAFIDDIKHRPLKLADDWNVLLGLLKKDTDVPWVRKLEAATRIVDILLNPVALLRQLWADYGATMTAVFDSKWFAMLVSMATHLTSWLTFTGHLKHAWEAFGDVLKNVFATALSGITSTASAALSVAAKVAGAVGASDLKAGLETARGAVAAVASVAGAESSPSTFAPLANPGGNTTISQTSSPTIHINVPPGTPAEVARRVGEAARTGVAQGTNWMAAQAALVPGGGR